MDLQSWAAFAAIFAALLANFAMTSRKFDKFESKFDARIDGLESKLGARIDALDVKIDGVESRLGRRIDALDVKIDGVESRLGSRIDVLDAKIGGVETKLESKIDHVRIELREEISTGFNRVDNRLAMLEQRTFDLSTRLPPAPSTPVARKA